MPVPAKVRPPGCLSSLRLWLDGQIAKGVYFGEYEPVDIKLMTKALSPGMIAVDGGSNIGYYSLMAAASVWPSGAVFAFEPNPRTYQKLLKNIDINRKFSDVIRPVNLGLGDADGQAIELRMDLGKGDAEMYSLPICNGTQISAPNVGDKIYSEIVKLTTLDSHLRAENVTAINFLKLDMEGFEYYALIGAGNIVMKSPNLIIMMECTPLGSQRAGYAQEDVYRFLESFGFGVYYYNSTENAWKSDLEGLKAAGNIWASKDHTRLPRINSVESRPHAPRSYESRRR